MQLRWMILPLSYFFPVLVISIPRASSFVEERHPIPSHTPVRNILRTVMIKKQIS
jgi:hypothetical protein